MSAVQITDLTVHYGEVLALTGVDLRLEEGRVIGLLGTNGAGKSTLFNAVMGLVAPTRGRVEVLGGSSLGARKRGLVAFVPQSERIDTDFPVSVRDVVSMGRYGRLGVTRRLRAADRDAVDAAIARVGLTELTDRQIGELSGGQRKRAFVARGIAQDARLLLLDEPFAGVDVTSQALITRLLHELRDEGRTVLISTHDLAGVPALCDEVVLLHHRVVFQGDPAEALAPERLALAFVGPDVADAAHAPPAGSPRTLGSGPAHPLDRSGEPA